MDHPERRNRSVDGVVERHLHARRRAGAVDAGLQRLPFQLRGRRARLDAHHLVRAQRVRQLQPLRHQVDRHHGARPLGPDHLHRDDAGRPQADDAHPLAGNIAERPHVGRHVVGHLHRSRRLVRGVVGNPGDQVRRPADELAVEPGIALAARLQSGDAVPHPQRRDALAHRLDPARHLVPGVAHGDRVLGVARPIEDVDAAEDRGVPVRAGHARLHRDQHLARPGRRLRRIDDPETPRLRDLNGSHDALMIRTSTAGQQHA